MSTALLILFILTLIFYVLVFWFLVRLVRAHPAALGDIAPWIFGWLREPGWFKRWFSSDDDRRMEHLAYQGRL